MSVLFLVSVFTGLALGSLFMWRGIERPSRNAPEADSLGRELPAERFGRQLPTGAALFFTLGIVGYQLVMRSSLSSAAVIGIALLSGVMVALLVFVGVTRWVVPVARRSMEDPRFALQGVPGTVTTAIDAADSGEIGYETNGRAVTIRARSIDGSGIPRGADVAIDRLEDGVAYVELWSHVEERL